MSPEPTVRAHPEPVVLKLGGGFGALVVHWDASQIDTAIEISPAGRDDDRQHQHILERPLPDRIAYAAVFDAIAEGRHTLWVRNEVAARDVEITDGRVTELHWDHARTQPD